MNLSDVKTGIQHRPPRIVMAGVEKIGKSTFAAGAPNPIFLPIKGEDGIDALDVARTPVIDSYINLLGALQMLAEEHHDYKTIVIDSVSTVEPLIWQQVCVDAGVDTIEKVGGGFGKGYIEAVYKWREIMAGLDYLRDQKNMCSIMIGHVAVKTFTDPVNESYDQYELDIQKRASSALLRWSDCILFSNSKTVVKTDENTNKKRGVQRTERVLYTQKRPAHMGGGRGVYGQLPYELDMSFSAFADAVKNVQEVSQ